MKKTLLFAALSILLLTGCSKTTVNTKTGSVDCQSISYTVDQNHNSSLEYRLDYVYVGEFKSESGAVIYASNTYGYLNVYENAYTSNVTTYSYVRTVGCLNVEQIYILDLDSLTIDCVTKYSKYLGDLDKDQNNNPLNHNEAYQCASKGFYLGNGKLIKGITDTSLERHSYIKLGVNAIVSYTPRIS